VKRLPGGEPRCHRQKGDMVGGDFCSKCGVGPGAGAGRLRIEPTDHGQGHAGQLSGGKGGGSHFNPDPRRGEDCHEGGESASRGAGQGAAAPGPHFEERFHCASQCAPAGVAWENLTTALVRLQAGSMDELPGGPPKRPQNRTTIHLISSVDQHSPVRRTPAGSTLCP
jgi:hypothetical protein